MPMGTATQLIATDFKLEPITLQEALGRAFEHNLEARFDQVDIKISAARVRFAAGAFDPGLHHQRFAREHSAAR
jgi:hypothetical protein